MDEPLSFEVTVRPDPDARIARAIVAGEWPGEAGEARALLEAVCASWPGGAVDFLTLCGGFLRFRWPDRLRRREIGNNLDPAPDVMGRLLQEGEQCVRSVVGGRLRRRLRGCARYLTLGADARYFVGSDCDPHVELVFLLDLASGRLQATGKSYPNPRQQGGLVRVTDLAGHFVRAGGEDVLLLKCHDLNMFSPRSLANARGWRREAIGQFRALAEEKRPALLFWHPHKSDTPRTWIPGLGGLRKALPDIGYAGGGVYYNDGRPPRARLESVLRHTKNVPCIDLIVARKEEGPGLTGSTGSSGSSPGRPHS